MKGWGNSWFCPSCDVFSFICLNQQRGDQESPELFALQQVPRFFLSPEWHKCWHLVTWHLQGIECGRGRGEGRQRKCFAIWDKGIIRYPSWPMSNGNGNYGLQKAGQQYPTYFCTEAVLWTYTGSRFQSNCHFTYCISQINLSLPSWVFIVCLFMLNKNKLRHMTKWRLWLALHLMIKHCGWESNDKHGPQGNFW